MSSLDPSENREPTEAAEAEPGIVMAGLCPVQAVPVRRRVFLPAALFVATCLSALLVGSRVSISLEIFQRGAMAVLAEGLWQGLLYAVPLMTILVCHEAGHFLQAQRYGVRASYPYFLPMPISPFGTFGAVIAMEPRMGNRRALFDIGISGPLAGLVPTIIFCVWGLQLSNVAMVPRGGGGLSLGEPLLFKILGEHLLGPIPPGHDIFLHPMAFAGWVGLLITALNLFPIGQLDGGHILYGLLRKKAHPVAAVLLGLAAGAVVWGVVYHNYVGWTVFLLLLMLMGSRHPPTADDDVPLGAGRTILGWLTLAFLPLGFTPTPILLS